MSEKDVYELFDKMFEQLENDDPQLQQTSATDLTKIVNEKLDGFAKSKGFDDFDGMVNKNDNLILDESKLLDIVFSDKRDFLTQALSMYKDVPNVSKYLDMIDNNEDLEKIYELVNDEYKTNKESCLKYIVDAYNVYKEKAMKQLNDSLNKK